MPERRGDADMFALHEAAKRGDLGAIRRALSAGVHVDARDEEGRTALHHAARALEAPAIDALLAAGAAVDIEDRWSCTPLWHAVLGPGGEWLHREFELRQHPCVDALCRAGADPEHPCRDPRFEGFNPQTPWMRGMGIRGAFRSAAPGYATDPEFCAADQPFDVRGGFTSGRQLWLDSTRLDACLGFARKHGIERIFAGCAFTNEQKELLRGLRLLPALEHLTVRSRKKEDMRWIESLEELRELLVLDPVRSLDLHRFTRLETLSVAWSRHLEFPPLESPLETLGLIRWTPQPSDLRGLRPWKSLRTFSIGLGSVQSLGGIEVLENLEQASIHGARSLVDVQSLARCRNLRRLRLDDCRRAVQLDVIRELKNLEELVLIGRFSIPSLSFIEDLPRLRSIRFFRVDVEDGDMRPLLRVAQPFFSPDKRHYSHTCGEIEELIGRRRSADSKLGVPGSSG